MRLVKFLITSQENTPENRNNVIKWKFDICKKIWEEKLRGGADSLKFRLTKAPPNPDNYSVARFDNDLSKDRAGSH